MYEIRLVFEGCLGRLERHEGTVTIPQPGTAPLCSYGDRDEAGRIAAGVLTFQSLMVRLDLSNGRQPLELWVPKHRFFHAYVRRCCKQQESPDAR